MIQSSTCHTCGKPIAHDDLGGLCPACVFGFAIEERTTDSRPDTQSLLHIPGYEVRSEIARGGMGIVYKAMEFEPRREVALKMLLPHQLSSPGMRERFHLESRALAALEHPAILPVYRECEHNGLPFFTMKLAGGGNLLQRKQAFAGDWRRIAELIARLADAVQFAHEHGVLHRDLKPGNVLFDEAGDAYVCDFGLAKLADAHTDLTRSVDLLGTPHYLAPEVAARSAKEATTASDIYSLGAILYELLTGRPPFEADGVPALLKKIAEEQPISPRFGTVSNPYAGRTTLPRDLEIICLKCLAKEPGRRYATARELAEDLRRWLEGRTILARPATAIEQVQSWVRRNPALATMATILATVLTAAVIQQARTNRQMQHVLAESLLRQAQLERSSGHAGRRFEALPLVSRAAELLRGSGGALSGSNLVRLRSEAAATLALTDLRPMARWAVHVSDLENEFDFDADLERYASVTPDGGIVVAWTANHQLVGRVAGDANNPVVKVRLNPTASWVAARFRDGHAQLYRVTGELAPLQRWPGVPRSGAMFDFSSTGDYFAVITSTPVEGRFVQILSLDTDSAMVAVRAPGVTTLSFSDSGSHLALCGKELAVWRVSDTTKLWSVPFSHEASALAWSPQGDRIAVALDRRNPVQDAELREVSPVTIFNAASGEREFEFAEYNNRVARMAFHPTHDWLITATWNEGLTGRSLDRESNPLMLGAAHRALKFSREGNRLGYAPSMEELGLLEVSIPTVLRSWGDSRARVEESFKLTVSTDGRWVVSTSDTMVRLWDATEHGEIDSRPLPSKAYWAEAFFGPANESICVSAASFGVRRWLLTPGVDGRPRFGVEQIIDERQGLLATGYSHDQRSLIVGDHGRTSGAGAVGPRMQVWPDGDPGRARTLTADFPLTGYRVVPHSRWAISTSLVQPDLWIWDFETAQRLQSLGLGGRASGEPVANGRWLVARTRDEFGVWEVGTWKRLAHWPARSDEASMNLFSSPDSRLLATHNNVGRFILRELPEGNEVIHLTPPDRISVQHHQFSPDSSRLIFLGNNGQMFDWDLSELRRELGRLGLDLD